MKKGLCLVALLLLLTSTPAHLVAADSGSQQDYYAVQTTTLADGTTFDAVTIAGPPEPPPGFERPLADPQASRTAHWLYNVPAFNWSFGCSATSGAMMAGYYDRTGYANMYAGPTNGSVMPLDNSPWPDVVINTETRHQCPLSATRNGLDGRTSNGHVDDYWVSYNSPAPDPFLGNWPEHSYADCTGDFMKTNQSIYGNVDGGTTFFYLTSGAPTTAAILEGAGGGYYDRDGGYGLKLFFESRGYTVSTMFNQYIEGWTGTDPGKGFTYEQYKAQIDAGRPVLIHITGHTMLGVGYDDTTNDTIFLHDTWNYAVHSMVWGQNYSGMTHKAVTVIELAPPVCTDTTDHSITVDGTLAEWCRSTERIETDSRPVAPVPGDQDLLVTWDATNIYLGWQGADWDNDGDLWLYFYSRTAAGTTSSVNGAHSFPLGSTGGGVDHALLISEISPTLSLSFYDWNGSTWALDGAFAGAAGVSGDLTEVAVPRAELGMSANGPLGLIAFAEGEGDNASWASFPTANPLGTAFTMAYEWSGTGAGATPATFSGGGGPTAVHLQNVQSQPSAALGTQTVLLAAAGLIALSMVTVLRRKQR